MSEVPRLFDNVWGSELVGATADELEFKEDDVGKTGSTTGNELFDTGGSTMGVAEIAVKLLLVTEKSIEAEVGVKSFETGLGIEPVGDAGCKFKSKKVGVGKTRFITGAEPFDTG